MPTTPEIYPLSFETKIGFTDILSQLEQYCSSSLGQERIARVTASTSHPEIHHALEETGEMMAIYQSGQSLPSLALVDIREGLGRIRPARTYMEEQELVALGDMLGTLHALHHFFTQQSTAGSINDESLVYTYPRLSSLFVGTPTFPKIEQALLQLFDRQGHIKDTASRELLRIRREMQETERSLSGMLQRIVRLARQEGWIEDGVQPAVRDGRLVIPLAPEHKRKIKGIVHDESGTGKTVYVEPVELVEANNRIRELEGEERKEIVRILIEIADRLRPNITHLLKAYDTIAHLDAVQAKARWGLEVEAHIPELSSAPCLEWYGARHPLLLRSLKASGREIVPLDIQLSQEHRILIISGPNAGGKSVCLKTVGLLQYMLQSGLPIPIAEHSKAGIFEHFFIDIGDEQSLEDDLSTYSSHLTNMKHFERHSDERTLILIDEFGGGTEPTIGGAIAEALLEAFNSRGAYGVITTHYQNLKTYAEHTAGLVNGAMLYDRHLMRPLFRLSIGRPGSSFAIEIARKIGLGEHIIQRASDQVGSHYIDMDKYLQDIVRDKRYWEGKRQSIRKEEKRLQEAAESYLRSAEEVEEQRRKIIKDAKAEAERIVQEANARIERTIKEIREAEAERERTQQIRASLKSYTDELQQEAHPDEEERQRAQRQLDKVLRRQEGRKKGGSTSKKGEQEALAKIRRSLSHQLGLGGAEQRETELTEERLTPLSQGDYVRLDGQKLIGTILSIKGKTATIELGAIKMTVELSRLHRASEAKLKEQRALASPSTTPKSSTPSIIDQIHDKRLHFRSDLDVRGMRAAEAVQAVTYFVDDALQLGVPRVRVLHGTGTGALREAIRQYLAGVPAIRRYADEHVQLGGAGITVIDLS